MDDDPNRGETTESMPQRPAAKPHWLARWPPHGVVIAFAFVGPLILLSHPYFELKDWVFWQIACLVFAGLAAATKVFVGRYPRAAVTSYVAGLGAQVLFVLASIADTNREIAAVWNEYTLVG